MYDHSYRRRRGELQSLGEILHAALQVADPNYYRPEHPFRHGRSVSKKKKQPKDDGKLRGVQLELFAPNLSDGGVIKNLPLICERDDAEIFVARSSAITPENPITDADVPF